MEKTLRVLIIEDSSDDALLLLRQLKKEGYAPDYEIVSTAEDTVIALKKPGWDIILSDYLLPDFSGLEVLRLLSEMELDIPCLIVSGKIDEETAVAAMRAGAKDYIMKDNLKRLGSAIERELQESSVHRERNSAREQLKESEEYFRSIIENAQDLMLVINSDCTIRYGNPAVFRLSGYSNNEIIGRSIYDFIHPEDVGKIRQAVDRCLNYPDFSSRIEVRVQDKMATWHMMELIGRNAVQNPAVHGIIVNMRDISETKAFQQELEYYARRIIEVQEEERKRVSRELHDDTAQSLAIIKMEIESLLTSGEIQSEKMLTRLSQLRDNVDRTIQDIRRYSHELRPGILDYFGLEDALEQMAAEIAERFGLDIQFDITGEVRRLTEDVELALFRIAQEAVNNICKHAEATSAVMGLTYYPDKVRMVIADNGKGFSVKLKNGTPRIRGSLGLLGMRERAHLIGADLNIESSPGRGTRVSVEVRC